MDEKRRISAPIEQNTAFIRSEEKRKSIKSMYDSSSDLIFHDEEPNINDTTIIKCSFDTSIGEDLTEIRQNTINTQKQKKNCLSKYFKQKCINIIRIISIIYICLIIGIIILAIALYFKKEGKHNYILACFEFDEGYFPFLTNQGTFFICIFILFFILVCILNSLVRNDYVKIKKLIINYLLYYNFTLGTIASSFIIGMVSLRYYYTIGLNIGLAVLGLISSSIVYFKSKKQIYKTVIDLINENFMTSVLLSLQSYMLLYNIEEIITRTPHNLTLPTAYKLYFSIGCDVLYFCIGIFALTFYQDIIFPIIEAIIDTGMLTKSPIYSFYEILTSIFVVLFLFYAVVLTIFKLKLNLFKIDLDEEKINQEKLHRKSYNRFLT